MVEDILVVEHIQVVEEVDSNFLEEVAAIVTWNEERTIEKKGYTIKVVPVGKF